MAEGGRGQQWLTTVLVTVFFLMYAGGVVYAVENGIHQGQVAYQRSLAQQRADDRRWCATLSLLTEHPVPRPANPGLNPAREEAYVLYQDFLTLRKQLGC